MRNTVGVVTPLIVGAAMGMPLGGLAVASGALQVSYSDSPGPYAQRARHMIAASVLCSLAVVAGGLAVRWPYLAGAIVTVWAFIAGLAVCLGPAAESLGVISLVTLIIYAVLPLTVDRALISGLLALGGGLLQSLLSLVFWPLHRYNPERRVLSALYLELSHVAVTPAGPGSPPASDQSTLARQTLAGLGNDTSLEAERYWSLLNQAERIRLSLFTLRRLRARLERADADFAGLRLAEAFLNVASSVLAAIAASLPLAQPADAARERLPELVATAVRMRDESTRAKSPFLAALSRDALFQMEGLTGQLHSAIRSVSESTPAELEAFAQRDAMQPWSRRVTGSLAKMRANLTLESTAFRHAIRLSVCLAVGGLIAHQLHNRRSYWLAMTIVLVLKQEFATTLSRGVLRIGGTVLGLLAATTLFHFLPAGMAWKILMVAALVFLLRWVGPANYGVFTVTISALIVVLIALTGVSPREVIWTRGEMTVLGGLLALLTYLAWPTWEHKRVPQTLAEMLESYREYFNTIAEARIHRRLADETTLGRARMAGRLARSNLQASADRLRAEPGAKAELIDLLMAILANSHRFIRAAMALETVPPTAAPVRKEFETFAADINATLATLIAGLRGEQQDFGRLPDLREDHRRLVNSASSEISRYALVNEETDRMTNSLNTLTEQVRLWREFK